LALLVSGAANVRGVAEVAMELRQGTQAELWQALIREGARRRRIELDEHEESYLGFVLIRHQRDAQFAARTLALDWLAAHEERAQARADALRDVGDRCLLVAGLYPQLAQRRRVSDDYFVELGGGAYAGVADVARAGYASLFAQLARAFRRLVDVLRGARAVATLPPPDTGHDPDTRRHDGLILLG
jgi:hypothetical protein